MLKVSMLGPLLPLNASAISLPRNVVRQHLHFVGVTVGRVPAGEGHRGRVGIIDVIRNVDGVDSAGLQVAAGDVDILLAVGTGLGDAAGGVDGQRVLPRDHVVNPALPSAGGGKGERGAGVIAQKFEVHRLHAVGRAVNADERAISDDLGLAPTGGGG